MTDEYMNELWLEVEDRVARYERTKNPQDKMFLDCMVRDYESKMKLKLQEHG
jgi:hypothetical protein